MKRLFLSTFLLVTGNFVSRAQEARIQFTEYDLPNGLHVILHEDHTTPIVNVSVMYHVGSKNEDPQRTGFAHFFEHLLFEGTEHIGRGEYMQLVQSNGGVLNANTSHDRTYYFEQLPSNQLELGLWMEAERMLHAKIDSIGIETQRKVVKEEKKQSYDNRPYGQLMNVVFKNAFTTHPYQWMPIGTEQYIDEAKASEFTEFYKTFYVPDNAVLVVAGDFDPKQAKAWIRKYYGSIPKGTQPIPRPKAVEPQRTQEKRVTFYDDVQLPAVVLAYQGASYGSDDFYAIQMLNQLLSKGASSRLHKQLVDKDQKAVAVSANALPLEDPGLILMFGVANMGVSPEELEQSIKAEVALVKAELISREEFTKLQNQAENDFIAQNAKISGIAEHLATNYTYFRNTNRVNTMLEQYQKVTPEDLRRVANKYLNNENCLVLYYLPREK